MISYDACENRYPRSRGRGPLQAMGIRRLDVNACRLQTGLGAKPVQGVWYRPSDSGREPCLSPQVFGARI